MEHGGAGDGRQDKQSVGAWLADKLEGEQFFDDPLVELDVLDGNDVVVAFPAPEKEDAEADEGDAGFCAILSAHSTYLNDVLLDMYFHPHKYWLAEPEIGANQEVLFSPSIVVVDSDPTKERRELYQRVRCHVVSSTRFAAKEVEAAFAQYEARTRGEVGLLGGHSTYPTPGSQNDPEVDAPDEPQAPVAPPKRLGQDPSTRNLKRSSRAQQVRVSLASAPGERALSPEERKQRDEGSTESRGFLSSLFNKQQPPKPPPTRPDFLRIKAEDASVIRNSKYPLVACAVANKGGSGKTTLSLNLAATLSKMCKPKEWQEGLNVLLMDQNFGNASLRDRIRAPSGTLKGLSEYLLAARAADQEGEEEPSLLDYVTDVNGLEGLDVLLMTGDDEQYQYRGMVTDEDLERVYRAAGRSYDVFVVDLDKGLPQEESLAADLLKFWARKADVLYLVLDPSKDSFAEGSRFVEGSRAEFGAAADNGLPVVAVVNRWDEHSDAAHRWTRGAQNVGCDPATMPRGGVVPFLTVRHDKAMDEFAREGRPIVLESPGFAGDFIKIAIDLVGRGIRWRKKAGL